MPAPRDLDPGTSPAHFFGAEVRRAREAAGMTLAELGARVPCDTSTVSRAESGHLSPTERFASTCDEVFPEMGGWFTRFWNDSRKWKESYPRWFTDWLDAEGRASVLRWWEPLLIPGLLQTSAYALALFRAWRTSNDDEEIEQLVAARTSRQIIFDRPAPPSLWVVIDEGVLHRCIGSPKIMCEQLTHVAEAADRPGVRVHVVPSDIGAHIGLLGGFAIAGFDDDTTGTVYLESPAQGTIVKDSATVAAMNLTFDNLRSEALPRGASRELIMRVAEDYATTDMA